MAAQQQDCAISREGVLRGNAPKRRFGYFAAGGKVTAGPGRGAPGLSKRCKQTMEESFFLYPPVAAALHIIGKAKEIIRRDMVVPADFSDFFRGRGSLPTFHLTDIVRARTNRVS